MSSKEISPNCLASESCKNFLQGVVLSDKMNRTVVVSVTRLIHHPVYGKVLRLRKKYNVHDEHEIAKVGDTVVIKECAPKSKTKHMVLVEIVKS